jgi:hypothetical protein
MLHSFFVKFIYFFGILFPTFFCAGKFLDWHRRTEGQERTKDLIGGVYLQVSYGTLFQNYCTTLSKQLNKINLMVAYALILGVFVLCAVAINLYLFDDLRLRMVLFGRYFYLALALSVLGLLDLVVTKRLLILASRGKSVVSIFASFVFIYLSAVTAGAFLAAFFLEFALPTTFYFNFFFNRFGELLVDPFGPVLKISGANGNFVNVMAFAYPAVAISTFVLVSSIAIYFLALPRFRPFYDYMADRIFSKSEKGIHSKIAAFVGILVSIFLAVVCIVFKLEI